MSTTTRIGWLGGSFDPVHAGHIAIARLAADRLELDRVLLVPAAIPPHKRDRRLASGEDRLALLELACAADERLEPCDVELQRDGPSYSYDTACELHELLGPDTELLYVIGADTLADLPNWHRTADLCALVTFCAVTREGTELDPEPLLPLVGEEGVERIRRHLLVVDPHPASSTAIRAALFAGETPDWLPDGVLAEIDRRGLYGRSGASSSERS